MVRKHHLKKSKTEGDGLAHFIAEELASSYDKEATSLSQIGQAIFVLKNAREDLHKVVEALAKNELDVYRSEGGQPGK